MISVDYDKQREIDALEYEQRRMDYDKQREIDALEYEQWRMNRPTGPIGPTGYENGQNGLDLTPFKRIVIFGICGLVYYNLIKIR